MEPLARVQKVTENPGHGLFKNKNQINFGGDLNVALFISLITVFIQMIFLLFSVDYYARSVGIGEADYTALMFGIVFTSMLGFMYYFLFTHTESLFQRVYKKKETPSRYSISRYH